MLWWPEAEYQRIVRQVPDVRSVLGTTWRDHTATVESTLLALVPTGPASRTGSATAYCLAANFEEFCGYLRATRADPRQASTMTGYTERLVNLAHSGVPDARQPTAWPPAEDSRCWCGSNARYRRCCQRHPGRAT
jgi:SEC-C motif